MFIYKHTKSKCCSFCLLNFIRSETPLCILALIQLQHKYSYLEDSWVGKQPSTLKGFKCATGINHGGLCVKCNTSPLEVGVHMPALTSYLWTCHPSRSHSHCCHLRAEQRQGDFHGLRDLLCLCQKKYVDRIPCRSLENKYLLILPEDRGKPKRPYLAEMQSPYWTWTAFSDASFPF